MLVREMKREECEDLLARLGVGRLACARDNQPYIVPIYFASEPGCLYGFSTMGQKIDWMRSNPLVCVEADEVRSHIHWSSVILVGRYEELPDRPEYTEQRQHALSLLEKRPMWWQTGYAAAQTRGKSDQPSPIFYRIHIRGMSGRHVSPDSVEAILEDAQRKDPHPRHSRWAP